MSNNKIGDDYKTYPTDDTQQYPSDLSFLDRIKVKKMTEDDNESDTSEDFDDDTMIKKPSLITVIKITFLLSILFLLLDHQFIDGLLRRVSGLEGFNYYLIKVSIFSIFSILITYNFY
jgi:hypothetical protein